MGPDDVSLDAGIRAVYGAVYVRLGGKVHERVDLFLTKQALDQRGITDVPLYESELDTVHDRLEVRQVAGISERIKHDDSLVGALPEPMMNEVRADEARTSSNQQPSHPSSLQERFAVVCASATA